MLPGIRRIVARQFHQQRWHWIVQEWSGLPRSLNYSSGVGACALPFFFPPSLRLLSFIHDFLVDIGACRVEAGIWLAEFDSLHIEIFRNAGLKELPILRPIHDIRPTFAWKN